MPTSNHSARRARGLTVKVVEIALAALLADAPWNVICDLAPLCDAIRQAPQNDGVLVRAPRALHEARAENLRRAEGRRERAGTAIGAHQPDM